MAPPKGTPRVPKGTPKHPTNQLQVTTPKAIPSTPRRKPKPAAENESPDHLSSPFTPSIYTAPTPLKNAKVSPIPKTPVYKETATQTTTPRYSPGTINNPIILSSPKTPKTPDTPSEWHFDSNSVEGEAPSELSDDYESDFYLRSTPCPGGDDKDDEEDEDGVSITSGVSGEPTTPGIPQTHITPASPRTPKDYRSPENWPEIFYAPRRPLHCVVRHEVPETPPPKTPPRKREEWEGFF